MSILVDMILEDKIDKSKCRNIGKSRNKIVKICPNLDLEIWLNLKKFKVLIL